MLPRRHRLTKRHDIVNVLRHGTTFSTPAVSIHLRPRDDQSVVRIAVIVAKKVHTSAVRRHRYQRWLRIAATNLIAEFTVPSDMVWVAKPAIGQLNGASEVLLQLAPVFNQIKAFSHAG